VPDPVFLPRKLFIPGLQKVTVSPQADGSIDVTGNFAYGVVNLSGSPLSFNLPALLKLLEDLATDLPTLVADVTAVFAGVAPHPPIPASTAPTH